MNSLQKNEKYTHNGNTKNTKEDIVVATTNHDEVT
jgi:hypothetical protein